MYPPPAKIFHGPGPRKRSRGVAAKASERRPLGTPACAVIRLAKNALCASRRSMVRSFPGKMSGDLPGLAPSARFSRGWAEIGVHFSEQATFGEGLKGVLGFWLRA